MLSTRFHIKGFSFALVVLALASACSSGSSGVTNPPPKSKVVDPAISIHVMNRLDTTTTLGRSDWGIFALIYDPNDPAKAGLVAESSIGLTDVRLGHITRCVLFQSDSIGARFVVMLAVADTVHGTQTDAASQSVAQAWYTGNHTVPSGWAAIVTDSLDWGVSTQFTNGHGLTTQDPVRWDLTLTSPDSSVRAEAPTDSTC